MRLSPKPVPHGDGKNFDKAAADLARRHQAERPGLSLDALGLDFYHLGENVHKARREIYGEEDAAGKGWAGALPHAFRHEGYQGARERLPPWRLGVRRGRREAADRLLN